MSILPPTRKVLTRKFYVENGVLYVEELSEPDPMPELLFPGIVRVVVNRPVAPHLVYIEDERPA